MRLPLAACLFAMTTFAHGADSAPPESAMRLARLFLQLVDENGSPLTCAPDRVKFGEQLKRSYLQRPADFGGISPQSGYWPEMEELHYQYRIATCSDGTEMERSFALALARGLSVEDTATASAFFSSPAGKRFVDSMKNAGKDATTRSEASTEARKAADAAYTVGYRELLAKYKREPK